jgi:superoxide reductase
MAEMNKNYKCSICGNLVKVLEAGIGELVCCGQPMNIVTEEVSTEQKPMAEETSTPISTPSEQSEQPQQSMPPAPETPTEESGQGEPQV